MLLASGDTGNIAGTVQPEWNQYGLVFTTAVGQNEVILKMLNNGIGGCGNDLAIDDIVFKSCGDFITLTNNENEIFKTACEDEGSISTTITATPDFSVFNTHFYQWQQSNDRLTWTNIDGATNPTYTTPPVTTSTYYRSQVAEDVANINNNLCNIVSDVFSLLIIPIPEPAISNGDVSTCDGEVSGISVMLPTDVTANWYDAETGGNLLLTGTNFFQTETEGTFYAEAISKLGGCSAPSRTAVSTTFLPLPAVVDENLSFCENETITLSAGVNAERYFWNTGEVSSDISTNSADTYTVLVTDANKCSKEKTIVLTQIDAPILKSIVSNGTDITVNIANEGDYEYAIDSGPFQQSPIFHDVTGGSYLISIRARNFCGEINELYNHIVIPQFFTPNGDIHNETFKPEGISSNAAYTLNIYDRYGTLLVRSTDSSYCWDGLLNGKRVPAADYWYYITIDDKVRKGHFSLIR